TGGTLTIGSDTYTVVSGHGVINHAHKMILHIVVKNSAGATFRLILHGDHAKPSSTTAFNVDFQMPQSKLARLWFLKFPRSEERRVGKECGSRRVTGDCREKGKLTADH